jgi:hypothetical protein
MRIADHLSKEQKQQLNKIKSPKKKKRKKKKEKVDWEDIMGVHRQTYYKKNGAWRGK